MDDRDFVEDGSPVFCGIHGEYRLFSDNLLRFPLCNPASGKIRRMKHQTFGMNRMCRHSETAVPQQRRGIPGQILRHIFLSWNCIPLFHASEEKSWSMRSAGRIGFICQSLCERESRSSNPDLFPGKDADFFSKTLHPMPLPEDILEHGRTLSCLTIETGTNRQ